MHSRYLLLPAIFLLSSQCGFTQLEGVTESHIAGHVPDPNDFRKLLIRDLTAYLKLRTSKDFVVDYKLLRDGPTQTGIGFPNYYIWFTATKPDKTVVDGVATVAAVDKKKLAVTSFLYRDDIISRPELLDSVFPKALIPAIRTKAGAKQ